MARSRRVSDRINNAPFESNEANLNADELAQLDEIGGPGYYSRTTLDDVINNFIISHTGEGKVLPKVPRHEVAYWAQRGLQEFSYDILLAEKNIEFELGASLSWALPADYVNYVKLTAVDNFGNDRTLHPSRRTNAKQSLLQDDSFRQVYDNNGEQIVAGKSISTIRFQDGDYASGSQADRQNAYGFDGDDIYDYYYSGYFGRRYGNDPQFENYNGTWQMDLVAGIIYFDSSFQEGDIIGLRYVSDGIGDNDDLTKVYIPKLAEDALYVSMLYNMSKIRPAAASFAPLYQKEMRAKMRNAKHRLSQYKLEEFAQVLRGRAKWIKH